MKRASFCKINILLFPLYLKKNPLCNKLFEWRFFLLGKCSWKHRLIKTIVCTEQVRHFYAMFIQIKYFETN